MKIIFTRISLVAVMAMVACGGDKPNNHVSEGDDDGDEVTDPNGGQKAPAPWTNVTFTTQDVEIKTPGFPAGVRGKLVRDSAGTLYYSYFRREENVPECDIALFGGGPAPSIAYDAVVAVKAAGATSFTIEKIPLDAVGAPQNQAYISDPLGLDAAVDNSNRLVLSLPAGGGGQFMCASSDLVVATRTGTNTYTFQVPTTGSESCCAVGPEPENCSDPACVQGTNVGTWPALAVRSNGNLAVAYSDLHFATDKDGTEGAGLELWAAGSGISGIRPWAASGRWARLKEVNGRLVVAYTTYSVGDTGAGAHVLVRQDDGHWIGQDQSFGAGVGERLELEVAPNGTVGLLYYAITDNSGRTVEDLYYCESTDNAATFPSCSRPESAVIIAGQTPSLAFDSQSRPVLSYYYCGSSGCTNDGLRVAWRDNTGKWWKYNVRNIANNRSGFYSSIVVDPTTDEPIIAFQDLTRGAAMVAYGNF